MTATLEDAANKIKDGSFEEAMRVLDGFAADEDSRAEHLFLRGFLKERMFDMEGALDTYQQVLELDEDHTETLFRAAMVADLRGDDEQAVELYERCARDEPAHVNALLNLAVLYEEQGRLFDAQHCIDSILEEHPNNTRARQMRRSVEASFNMHYDERSQREREKRNALLDIPITDFELSVRSRNCLKQMNIQSVGDLLRTTEEELLSYKNFGETSLNEIKAMLSQKNLRLGQALADSKAPQAPVDDTPESEEKAGLYGRSVSELELSVRSRKCLQRLGITTLAELIAHTEAELMATKNFGLTSLGEIKRQLSHINLSLRSPK